MSLITIKIYNSRHDAELAKGILDNNNIESLISADDCGGFRPELTFSTGVRLKVKVEDERKALELLTILD